jgi:hypothetical protein
MHRAEVLEALPIDTDLHLSKTKLRPLQAGDQARVATIVAAAAKKAAKRYRNNGGSYDRTF